MSIAFNFDEPVPPWRVGVFVSSSRRPKRVVMVAVGERQIAEYQAHGDFVCWLSPGASGNLNGDECAFAAGLLEADHGPHDFESECPGCTAYRKLTTPSQSLRIAGAAGPLGDEGVIGGGAQASGVTIHLTRDPETGEVLACDAPGVLGTLKENANG